MGSGSGQHGDGCRNAEIDGDAIVEPVGRLVQSVRVDQLPAQSPVTIGAYDAKARLSELLDRVQRGEQIVITRHGKPVARLVPEGGHDRAAAHAAVARIRALRAKLAAEGVDMSDDELRALRDEGRR